VREHRGDLKRTHHAPPGDLGRGLGGDVMTVIDDPPGGRLEKFCQEVEHSRLAGPIRADQRMNSAAADLEVDSLDRRETAELFRQPAGLEDYIIQAQSLPSRDQYCFVVVSLP